MATGSNAYVEIIFFFGVITTDQAPFVFNLIEHDNRPLLTRRYTESTLTPIREDMMQHKNRVIGMVAITVAVGLTLGTVVIASGSGFSHKRGSDAGGDQIRVLPTSVQAQTAQPRRTTRQTAVITACQNKKTGVLAVKPKCSKKESKVSWNVAGQAGAAGANGAAGAAGPAGSAGSNATVSFYSTTWTTPVTVSPDSISSPLGVVCLAGDSAISGGVFAEGDGADWGYLQSSYADEDDDTQWVFRYGSDSPSSPVGGDLSVQFQIICSDN